uniref:ADAM10 endopeptidase n=1 Tax=Trichuris muris TaxID=70415 RepID=A0A5S6Q728_TRIMR
MGDENVVIRYLQDRGLLHSQRTCTCGYVMKLTEKERLRGRRWRCNNRVCRKQISLRSGTWFEGYKVDFCTAVKFMYSWSHGYTTIRFCCDELDMSKNTAIHWNLSMRDVAAEVLMRQPLVIGGTGLTVEVDETVYSKRKYQRGRLYPHGIGENIVTLSRKANLTPFRPDPIKRRGRLRRSIAGEQLRAFPRIPQLTPRLARFSYDTAAMLTNVLLTLVVFCPFQWLSVRSSDIGRPVFLRRYEHLNYDAAAVEKTNFRSKRSGDANSQPLRLLLKHNRRELHLLLKRDTSVFSSDHVLDGNGRHPAAAPDLSFLYEGHVEGDPGSYVYGSILDGIFDGHVHTGDGQVYHVERATKYSAFAPAPRQFHSIIYTDDDIDYAKIRVKRELIAQAPSCGLRGYTAEWMKQVQRSAVNGPETMSTTTVRPVNRHPVERQSEAPRPEPWRMYMPESNQRSRRNSDNLYDVRTCTVYMQADQKLWQFVYNHEGQRDEERTRNEILSLFNNHIKAVNAIYENTNFNGISGINFVVQRTTIFDTRTCPSTVNASHGNPFCEENVDVSNYLNLNSIKNHSDFCLAYALTYRDFVGGTLGLAWVASRQPNTSGGICEIYKPYSEGTRKVQRSLNTGIITLVNYHNRVPPKVSQLTLAHEIGHNFGSPHDYPSHCQPGLPDGNYIMFASATSGDKVNNGKFSICSVNNISLVLREVLRQNPDAPYTSGAKRNCFQRRKTSFCGNALVEDGEQCDCGFNKEECEQRGDRCCYPRLFSAGPMCTRKEGSQCSPSEGVCCSPNTCQFVPAGDQLQCRMVTECSRDQFCNGLQASCPPSAPQRDGTLCQENTKVCDNGTCSKSVCSVIDMEECFINSGSPEDQCILACKKRSDANAKCVPSYEIEQLRPHFPSKRGILLRPGSPCNDYRGYCDIFRKCRSVDANGPLARLKNLFFNHETLKTLSQWVQEKWWATVLMAIGLLLLMALFIRCCAVHTPSTNPRKPPAHSIYETLRHPSTLLRSTPTHSQPGRSRQYEQHPRHQRHHRHHRHSAGGGSRGRDSQLAGYSGHTQAVAEPPPPYSSAVSGMGPPRGHRKHRKHRSRRPPDALEMRSN